MRGLSAGAEDILKDYVTKERTDLNAILKLGNSETNPNNALLGLPITCSFYLLNLLAIKMRIWYKD